MDLRLTPEEAALATAIDGLAARFRDKPPEFHGFALVSQELEQQLAAADYFEIAATPELGAVGAVIAVERLARLPFTAEVSLSMLVRPHVLGGALPRPFALVEKGRPSRFLASAKTALLADGETLRVAAISADAVETLPSLYAYPMATLVREVETQVLSASDAAGARKWLRVALAAETAGLLQGAIDTTAEYLSLRKQFGRALGTFQALRHRLAECAVLVGGVKSLALKAAASADDGDAALAAFHAQDSATRVVYDLHQMFGAIGMTLEHPLHLFTYRLKALLSELGGRSAHAQAVVRHCFV